MSRKPVHIIAEANHSTMDTVWAAVRKLKSFTARNVIRDIDKTHKVNEETVRDYLSRLCKGKFIEVEHTELYNNNIKIHHYELINDIGIDAPRLTKEGKPTIQGIGREQMWRTMRIVKEFDYKTLALAASIESHIVKPSEAKYYIKHLKAAGYLHVVKPAKLGSNAKPATLMLIPSKFTGNRAPMVQKLNQVFDPNTNQVMYRDKGGLK